MKTGHLLLALAVLALGHAAYAKSVSFPGRDSCLSPGRSWKVICQEDKVHEGAYKLVLRNLKKGTEKDVFDGGRWCEVLWQKDESHFAITDWGGSNFSDILVQDPNQMGPTKSLRRVINMSTMLATVSQEELQGHCYWEALSWQADGQLRFRIYGHTDTARSREFSHAFLVKLPEGTITVVKSKRPNPQGGANGRQPSGSDTTRASATAASRRSP
jgi:hypothetical protein